MLNLVETNDAKGNKMTRTRREQRDSSRTGMRTAKRLVFLLAALLVLAAPAAARTITGTAGPDVLRGTDDDDLLIGRGGNDSLYGRDDDDRLYGGAGNDLLAGGDDDDRLYGGPGNDRLLARDGERDLVDCGPGRDRAIVDRSDRVVACESVSRRAVDDDDDD
jgi:Ca2+-binding RTX toxin-like protein